MMTVYIMRGIPGSGKSSIVKQLAMEDTTSSNLSSVSADYYFEDINTGEYKFDPTKLEEAHAECLRQFIALVMFQSEENSTVFVDNTNMLLWQLTPYLSIAKAYGCNIKIVEVFCDVLVAWKRCTHNVPLEVIERMANHYEPIPYKWINKTNVEFIWVDATNPNNLIWRK
mgnify:CR=1 FL=1